MVYSPEDHFCGLCQAIVCRDAETACIGDITVEYSCELISADYCVTQSAEMIFGAVHHVEAESRCQADSVLVIGLV